MPRCNLMQLGSRCSIVHQLSLLKVIVRWNNKDVMILPPSHRLSSLRISCGVGLIQSGSLSSARHIGTRTASLRRSRATTSCTASAADWRRPHRPPSPPSSIRERELTPLQQQQGAGPPTTSASCTRSTTQRHRRSRCAGRGAARDSLYGWTVARVLLVVKYMCRFSGCLTHGCVRPWLPNVGDGRLHRPRD